MKSKRIPKPPKLRYVAKPKSRPKPGLKSALLCAVLGHKENPGWYIDSHGGLDGLSYCERCGKYME